MNAPTLDWLLDEAAARGQRLTWMRNRVLGYEVRLDRTEAYGRTLEDAARSLQAGLLMDTERARMRQVVGGRA